MNWLRAVDMQRGDIVKVPDYAVDKLGTDEKVTVEVEHTHVFEGGSSTRTFTEQRSAKHLIVG